MARTDKFTRLAMIMLFAALAVYLGTYVIRALSDDIQTAVAVETTLRDSLPVSGIIVRTETVATSSKPYVSVTAREGARVSAGGVFAMAYSSEQALERAGRIRELENEILRLEATFSGADSDALDPSGRDRAISAAITDLSEAVARGELGELDRCVLGVASLIFANADLSGADNLSELKNELEGLYVSAATDTMAIFAESPGLFSSIVDGYEHITPSQLSALTPDSLRSMLSDQREKPENAIGKLVTGIYWYFAAAVTPEFASKLERGDVVSLEFARYYNTTLEAAVSFVGKESGGECVVVFSCSEAMSDMLAMRLVSAEAIISSRAGIRVPKKALYTDQDGGTFVYTLTGLQAERKDVDVIAETEDYFLVEPGSESDSLRAGNEMIITSGEIFDGMVMG